MSLRTPAEKKNFQQYWYQKAAKISLKPGDTQFPNIIKRSYQENKDSGWLD